MSESSPAPAEPAASPANGAEPVRLEDMVARTLRFARAAARGSLEEPLDGVRRRIAVGAAGLTVALVLGSSAYLLIVAGVVILLSHYLPLAVACLVVGAFALLGGVLAFTLATRR